jgi:hypothetical protein
MSKKNNYKVKLSDKTINQFQQIYFEQFGETITVDQALKKCIKLVSLVDVIRKYSNKKYSNPISSIKEVNSVN